MGHEGTRKVTLTMSHKIVNKYILEELQIHSKTQNTKTQRLIFISCWYIGPSPPLSGWWEKCIMWSLDDQQIQILGSANINTHQSTCKYTKILTNTMPIIDSKEWMYLAAEIPSNIFDDCRSLFSCVLLRDWEKDKKGQMFIWQIIFLSKAGLFLGCSGKKVT